MLESTGRGTFVAAGIAATAVFLSKKNAASENPEAEPDASV